MYFRLAIYVVLVLSLPLTAFGQNAEGSQKGEEKKLKITRLTLEGVNAIEEQELLDNVAVSESGCIGLLLRPICWITTSPIFYKKAYLDREELARDMLRIRVLYFKHGYRNTTVDTVLTRKGKDEVHVTLKVTEGLPTTVSDIIVNQTKPVLRGRITERAITLERGEPFSLIQLDSSRNRLRARLWNRGYADAIVDTAIIVDTASKTAQVTLNIDPRWQARVKDITIYGNRRVEDSSILQSLLFKPGDLYRSSTILESQRLLYESNLFRRASIEVLQDEDSLKSVAVIVQEGPLKEARISAGFNTVNFVEVGARYTNYNWFGKARRFTISGSVGNLFASGLNGKGIFYDVGQLTIDGRNPKYFKPTYTVSAESRRPWFLSPNNEIALGVFASRRSVPGIYVDQGYGASGTFTRRLTTRAPASINYRFEVTNVDAGEVYFCVNYGVCDNATLGALRTQRKLSPLAITASIDRTNNPFQPRRGWRTQLDTEIALSYTASDFRYGRISAEAATFFPIGTRSTIGMRIRGGYVNPLQRNGQSGGDVLHPRKRFYAGGSQSVRGFGESQLGPRVLTIPAAVLRSDTLGCPAATFIGDCDPNTAVLEDGDFDPRPLGGNTLIEASVEYRFPLFMGLTGAVFLDGAYVAQNINSELPKSKAVATPGIGVRYLTAVGPIRVDLGINPVTTERLPVITEDDSQSGNNLVRLNVDRTYAPSKRGLRGALSRLRLHLSIGEAF
jgi:translocation and assembly module TamA